MFKTKNIKVDADKLKQAREIFKAYDLTPSEVFNIFLDKVNFEGKLPFTLKDASIEAKERSSFLKTVVDIMISQCEYIYYIDVENNNYREHVNEGGYEVAGVNRVGEDWFRDTYNSIPIIIHEDDRARLREQLTKKNILEHCEGGNTFSTTYRMITTGKPIYHNLIASLSNNDGVYIIVEVRNVQKQFEKEAEYKKKLEKANEEARFDLLTHCYNYLAFDEVKHELNRRIANKQIDFALAMCDLNDLKIVNDTLGHFVGDQYLIESSEMIRGIFKKSRVFRIGGDEFIVLLEGEDYENRYELVKRFKKESLDNSKNNKPAIAIGLAEVTEYTKDIDEVYQSADAAMYINKRTFKIETA